MPRTSRINRKREAGLEKISFPKYTGIDQTSDIKSSTTYVAVIEEEESDRRKYKDRSAKKNAEKYSSLDEAEDDTITSKAIVTPDYNKIFEDEEKDKDKVIFTKNVRRSLLPRCTTDANDTKGESNKSGRSHHWMGTGTSTTIQVPTNVRKVYTAINKMTGRIGGNGSGGAIYGELTVGSMQKMVNQMKKHTQFSSQSRFIDVGCGLGKPNIHVAQDPGVEFSFGIEMEKVRWLLGMHNLYNVLSEARKENGFNKNPDQAIRHRCAFMYGNITSASSFDPFTHVYMFDIGFPPTLFHILSQMFNRSHSPYLICYHGPKLMVERYKFEVELVTQLTTSMYGSSENHMGYIYRRTKEKQMPKRTPCDPLYRNAWELVDRGLEEVSDQVKNEIKSYLEMGRPTRTRKRPKFYAN